ncbi:hypothetical protein PM082_004919 [Marasmius tenuissimus]|nr:hypothetical protein PM082_004919 [Marasmius tenuissimus]
MSRPDSPRTPRPRRLHRLPQRLDYTLIPAPLDVSLANLTEKSPLPAIIVTPSSPSDDHRFSIAFLAPPSKPKPPLREILPSLLSSSRTQTAFLFLVIAVVMVCHLVAHQMATQTRYQPDSHSGFTSQDARSIEEWFASHQHQI